MNVEAASWLRVDPATRPGYVLLTAPWVVDLADGWWIHVEPPFACDGASIPAVLRPLFPPLTLLAMGVAHDYASRRGALLQPPEGSLVDPVPFTPRSAASLAVAFARDAGIGAVRRGAIWAALVVAAPAYWQRRDLDWIPVE